MAELRIIDMRQVGSAGNSQILQRTCHGRVIGVLGIVCEERIYLLPDDGGLSTENADELLGGSSLKQGHESSHVCISNECQVARIADAQSLKQRKLCAVVD